METRSDVEENHYEEGPSTSNRNKLEREDGHGDTKDTNRKLGREVDERIFTYVSDLVPFSTAKFGILQLGPYCNATESCLFTEANCHVKTVMNENDLALILEFNQLFSKGVQLLSDLKGNVRELQEHELAAIRILDDFFKEKDQHEQSLHKILRGHQSDGERKVNSETDTTIALAEHLLGKLSPGKSYIIDSRVKRKGKCRCGFNHCKSDPVFGSTGIGHEDVWHGFIDIIFSSHAGIPETAASFVDSEDNVGSETLTCPFDEREDETAGDSPGGRTILSGAESQAVAQTIVFSFIQKQKHPNFSNFLVPNIFISTHEFRIVMYDAVKDILICSVPLPIFQPYPSNSLQIASIIILWMVLHYRMFCVGIDTKSVSEMKKIQSNFKERAKDKLDIYVNASKFGVQGFPIVPRVTLPSHELLGFGIHLIPQK